MPHSKYWLLALAVSLAAASRASADDPVKPAPPLVLTLQLTAMADFDPTQPEGKLICLARNNADAPITLPAEYGGDVVLHGGRLTLYAYRPRGKMAPLKTIDIAPQEEAVLWELPLGELFAGRDDVGGVPAPWYWSWMARPAPPPTPIHALRNGGYVESAVFVVELHRGDAEVRSQPVTLKVKVPQPSKPSALAP